MSVARRNQIPNPVPATLTDWNYSINHATLVDFSTLVGGGLHFEADITAPTATAGVLFNDYTQITIRPRVRYGLVIDAIEVITRGVGLLRPMILWFDQHNLHFDTSFGSDLAVGTHTEVVVLTTAPAGAAKAQIALSWDGSDTTTNIEFTAKGFLLEPLDIPFPAVHGSVVNEIVDPSVEGGGTDWLPHTPEDNLIVAGTTYEPSTDWASEGTHSMHHRYTTGATLVGADFYGFIGSYLISRPCLPGDLIDLSLDVNVTHRATADGPGLFLEHFYYFYDGDPADTVEIAHYNSDTVYEPVDLGVQHLSHSSVCPVGANFIQTTVVLVSGSPSTLLEFYADAALLAVNGDDPAWFDGDTAGAGWVGYPNRSASVKPGRDARVPAGYFDGDDTNCQWEGPPGASVSTMRRTPTPQTYRRGGDVLKAMQLIQRTNQD